MRDQVEASFYVDGAGYFVEVRAMDGQQLASKRGGNVSIESLERVDPPAGADVETLRLWAYQSAVLMASAFATRANILHDQETEGDCLKAFDEMFGASAETNATPGTPGTIENRPGPRSF